MNKIIQSSVGADLSCSPPIHRPQYASTYVSSQCHPPLGVILSEAKDLAAAPHLPLVPLSVLSHSPTCHPERSEGSTAMGVEMLRCAQHDRDAPCCCAFHVYRVKSYSPSLFTSIQH